jgi:hypothetical protein
MKNLFKVSIIIFILILGSCADFLEEELTGTYSTESFYKTEEHAQLAIAGVYNIASFVSTNNALWVFGDVASDDAVKGGSAGDQSDIQFLEEFNYSRNNGYLEKIWEYYYEGITRANYLLYYGNDIEMDAILKAQILGEAKFLRAYFYFNLVNIFGEIPLKTQPPLNADLINIGKSPVSAIYAQIEADLIDAVTVLESTSQGRATKASAWGLLAKVKLFQGEWQETLTAIDSLEASGTFTLEPLYKNNFQSTTQNNSESIFEIQHLSGQTPKLGSHLNQWFGDPNSNGYYFNVPTVDYINEFESSLSVLDPRLDYTVGREGQAWINGEAFDPLWSPTGYLQKKHLQSKTEEPIIGDASLNYTYMRYADVLLMKAEALNELNNPTEAILPLNEVRKRARESYLFDEDLPGFGVVPVGLLPDVTAGSQASVRNAIRHERRVELGFEFHRFFDLMRYGQATAEAALANTNFDFAQHRYFLIPQSEIDANTAIDE